METVNYEQFSKLDIRVAEIKSAKKHENADRLLVLEIDLGEESLRTLVAGIAGSYEPEDIIGKRIPVLANLEPRNIRGVESNGMILAANDEGRPVLLTPDRDVSAGTQIT